MNTRLKQDRYGQIVEDTSSVIPLPWSYHTSNPLKCNYQMVWWTFSHPIHMYSQGPLLPSFYWITFYHNFRLDLVAVHPGTKAKGLTLIHLYHNLQSSSPFLPLIFFFFLIFKAWSFFWVFGLAISSTWDPPFLRCLYGFLPCSF